MRFVPVCLAFFFSQKILEGFVKYPSTELKRVSTGELIKATSYIERRFVFALSKPLLVFLMASSSSLMKLGELLTGAISTYTVTKQLGEFIWLGRYMSIPIIRPLLSIPYRMDSK